MPICQSLGQSPVTSIDIFESLIMMDNSVACIMSVIAKSLFAKLLLLHKQYLWAPTVIKASYFMSKTVQKLSLFVGHI